MGAGTSTGQGEDKTNDEQAEQCVDLGQQEQDGQEVEVNIAGDVKLLHTNGKIAIINGATEEGVEEGLQVSDVNGHGIGEEIIAVVKEVEHQEPASVTLDKEAAENMGIVHNDTTAKETAKEDEQVETPEAIDITPESEEKAESPGQANENQNNEVGFKKVFKFVGFKFTVKKDKTEKSEPVQLLTVKKDEVEVNGKDNHEEHINTEEDGKTEIQQEPKNGEQPSESPDKPEQGDESSNETPEENQKKVEESEVEKDQKSPESPTNAVVTETSSPFRRFFTQGWAGLRKKTSFKKSKEEDPQEVEKQVKVEEQEKDEVLKAVEEESTTETQPAENHSVPKELSKSSSEDSKVSAEENIEIVPEDKPKQEEPSPDNEAGLKLEGSVKEDEEVAPAAENKEYAPEIVTSVPEAIELPKVKAEAETLEDNIEIQTTDEIAVEPAAEGINEDLQGTSETGAVDNDQSQLVSSTESGDAITTEAELLSTQEKAKIQGSPLKKLFSSSGLRKLSGKKTKSKKEDEGKIEITGEAISSEFPEAPEIDGGDSSPSSPDESTDTSPTEKPSDEVQQTTEAEGEGATSDGERRKDGITPWASFKKLVTPKRRPKRPSESDKEDEVEKAKTSTMSSTDSAGTGENQEEPKETNEDQKLEKSTEESKKKVDTSVSWEALICVGSAKKRTRKTSDSDEDEGIKSQDEAKKSEEIVPAKETDSDSPITSSQEQQIQESTSPDQTGSPTESDGVSTWQSFKRLVTPRRKSRTRVEDKSDETATAANAEQSTSEGEAGKEETWVSFKKLIPGRKKKKSDGKQEHAPTTEAGQALNEAAEDDSDEPAVVPLSEFDAAEQEKLDAQKSLEEALPTIGGEQEGSLEKSTEELIHAVTVTVIEGERAITSLEERSPSWISATVSENIEHAKETEEAIERIKTEVTVEETVVLSTVSQVMTVVPNTLMNEMELTSEALTALEEAIENSCAEETTEMISAVSQLGESVVSTEEATPVPEEDATMKTLEDQKKHTENVLHEAAEKAKLTINTLQLQTSQDVTDISATMEDKEIVCQSAPLCAEEQTCLTPVALEDQDVKSTIESAEETVEQICISVIQKTKESVTTSETVQNYLNTPVANLDQTVNICISTSLSKEEQADKSTFLSTDKSDGHLLISSEDQVVEETVVTESVVKDITTDLEVVCAKVDSLSAEDVMKYDDLTSSTEVKESVLALAEVQDEEVCTTVGQVQIADNACTSNELQTKESVFASAEVLPVSREVQPEEVVSVSTEVQHEEVVPVSSEIQTEDVTGSSEYQPEVIIALSSEVKSEENVSQSSKIHPEEVIPPSSERLPVDVVKSEIQLEEVVTASSEVQPEDVAPVSSEVQPEEVAHVSSEVQPEDIAPVSSEVQPEEVAPVSSGVQLEEAASVTSEAQPEEVVPVSSKVQPEEIPLSNEVQPEEDAPVPSKVQSEEVAPVSSELQPEEVAPVSSGMQLDEVEPSELQPEEFVHVSSELQPKEVAPVSHEVQPEEVAPASCEVEPEEFVLVTSELQPEGGLHISSELQSEEVVPISSEVQPDNVEPVCEVEMVKTLSTASDVQPEDLNEVRPEECVPVSVEMESEEGLNVPVENKVEECFSVPDDAQAEEGITVPAELQTEESVPVLSEAQDEASASVLAEAKIEESSSVLADVDINKVAPMLANLQVEEQAPESFEMQAASSAPISKAAEDNVQVDEGTNLLAESQAENTLSAFAEAEAQDSAQVSTNVQTEEVGHRTSEVQAKEVSSLSDELQAEESSQELVELQTEESVEVTQVSTEVHTEKIAPLAVELTSDVQSEVCEVQAEEVTKSVEIQDDGNASAAATDELKENIKEVTTVNKVDAKENVSNVAENDVQESERVLVSGELEESCSDSQIQKVITEGAMTVTDVLLAEPQTSELQSESTCMYSDNTEFTETPPTTALEEVKEPEEVGKDKITHSQEEIVQINKEEEVVPSDIPELESSEAIKASEPVTAAAVEEQVLAETVKDIEVPQDSIEPSDKVDHDRRSEDIEVLSNGVQVIAESVSQKAAAIVDAAIEAATNCFVVDATSQDKALEETTVSEHVEITEETNVQTISIESCSTTIVQSIIETAVETIVSNIHINKTVSIQGQNLKNEIDSQHQETVPVHEPIKSSEQLEESEQELTERVQNTGKESESATVAHTQDENEQQTSTQASEVNAQEKAPTVES